MTFSLNKWQWIKVWSKESRSPQYKHLPSTLIPNLKSSFLVTTILREILKCNSSSFTSLQIVLKKLKIGFQLPRSISNVLSHFFKPACFSVLVFSIRSQHKSLAFFLELEENRVWVYITPLRWCVRCFCFIQKMFRDKAKQNSRKLLLVREYLFRKLSNSGKLPFLSRRCRIK